MEFALGHVVFLRHRLLAVCVWRIFPQHAKDTRLHHVGVDAVAPNQLHKGGVVAKRPVKRLGEDLIGVGVDPVIVHRLGQRRDHLVIRGRLTSANLDGETGCLCRVHEGGQLVDMGENLVEVRRCFIHPCPEEVVRTQHRVDRHALRLRDHALFHHLDVKLLAVNGVFGDSHGVIFRFSWSAM